jgi:glycerophosphoryl diester phosphodiesterase
MENNIVIEGDWYLLSHAKEIGLKNNLFLFSALTEEAINLAVSNHYFGISTDMNNLQLVDLAHTNGLKIMSWSPNSYSQNKQILNNKVDIVQTDDPISMLKLLNRFNYGYIIP